MAGWGARLWLLLCLASLVSAGHFHHGTLSWRHMGDNHVELTLISTWSSEYGPYKQQGTGGNVTVGDIIRIQGLGNPVVYFGDGELALAHARVTTVNAAAKTFTGVVTLQHHYATQNNGGTPWLATFSGCCRSHSLVNNAEGSWYIYSTIDMAAAQFSPKAALPPLVTLRALSNQLSNSFYIAANDDGLHPTDLQSGTKLTYALTGTQSGGWVHPAGFVLDAQTGLVTANAAVGLYSMAVEMTNILTQAKAVVDFEVRVVANNSTMLVFDTSYPASRLPTPAINTIFVGFAEEFTVRFVVPGAEPSQADGTVASQFSVQSTSLPGNAALSRVVVNSWNNNSQILKGYGSQFTWTPTSQDVGWQMICLTATSSNANFSSSLPSCLNFRVLADPAPVWRLAMSPTSLIATMGKQLYIPLETLDMNYFDSVNISAVNAPAGATLTQSVSDQVPEGLVTRANFSWTPSERMGGLQGQLCFNALDDGSLGRVSDGPADACYPFTVPKCRYSVGPAESLVDIAKKFGTNWLQLWALNKEITRPEGYGIVGSVSEGYEINIGQLVEVRDGDSLEKIAARFGTTLRQTLGLNADITSTNPLVRGQLVCIVPNSCSERGVTR